MIIVDKSLSANSSVDDYSFIELKTRNRELEAENYFLRSILQMRGAGRPSLELRMSLVLRDFGVAVTTKLSPDGRTIHVTRVSGVELTMREAFDRLIGVLCAGCDDVP